MDRCKRKRRLGHPPSSPERDRKTAPGSQPAAPGKRSTSSRGLPEVVQAKMERAFGIGLSEVRIHEGSHVAKAGALAYTQGRDIHFAPGEFDPDSERGQRLLGHELTHVVQQAQGRVRATRQAAHVSMNDDPALEHEADVLGARAARGERLGLSNRPLPPSTSPKAPVQGYFTYRGKELDDDALQAIETHVSRNAPASLGEFQAKAKSKKDEGALPDWLKQKGISATVSSIVNSNSVAPPPKKVKLTSLDQMYEYDSSDLEAESDLSDKDAPETLTYKTKKTGQKTPLPVLPPDKAMKRTARTLRYFRSTPTKADDEETRKKKEQRKQTLEAKSRGAVATKLGGQPFLFQPTPWMKDVGGYPLERTKSGSWTRGNATPYAALGKNMDGASKKEKMSAKEANEELTNVLLGADFNKASDEDSRHAFRETSGVLLTDMARGSAGVGLAQRMLTENTDSFSNRFKPGGSYKPADKGGSRFIQEETKKRKAKEPDEEDDEEDEDKG